MQILLVFRRSDGYTVIKVPGEETCHHLYHSSIVGSNGRHGVAITFSEAMQAALLDWVSISPRFASAHLKGATVNVSVVAVNAQTLNAVEEAKDYFYGDLQDAIDSAPSRGMPIVVGSWNTRPGLADMAARHILGKFAQGTRCPHGYHLMNFPSVNRLVVSSTHFQHRFSQRHLVTWFSNDGRTRKQIDHMLVRSH